MDLTGSQYGQIVVFCGNGKKTYGSLEAAHILTLFEERSWIMKSVIFISLMPNLYRQTDRQTITWN